VGEGLRLSRRRGFQYLHTSQLEARSDAGSGQCAGAWARSFQYPSLGSARSEQRPGRHPAMFTGTQPFQYPPSSGPARSEPGPSGAVLGGEKVFQYPSSPGQLRSGPLPGPVEQPDVVTFPCLPQIKLDRNRSLRPRGYSRYRERFARYPSLGSTRSERVGASILEGVLVPLPQITARSEPLTRCGAVCRASWVSKYPSRVN